MRMSSWQHDAVRYCEIGEKEQSKMAGDPKENQGLTPQGRKAEGESAKQDLEN
jgi:hypothetical protein